jgi:organic hydroperoxide reductase OsmC/OhrA
MLGTLNGGLEARGVSLAGDQISAEAIGYNEVRDGLPVLVRVHVQYRLSIPAGTRETVERLLSKHADKCPTAATLKGAVEVTWSADINDR